MGMVASIVTGFLAGWLAARLTRSPHDLQRSFLVGLVGAVVGGFLARRLGVAVTPDIWGEIATAAAGAGVLLTLWQAVRRA
jgi:uncharacterized membrane protein YeaQ/YmgE (transglycosylase-associated protein family)